MINNEIVLIIRGNIGIAEKHRRQDVVSQNLSKNDNGKSCFVSYVIVKSSEYSVV